MKRRDWTPALVVLILAMAVAGCSRPTMHVAGLHTVDDPLPEGFDQGVQSALALVAEADFPLNSLTIRSVLHLGTYSRRWVGAAREEDNYLVVVTLDGENGMKVVTAQIRVATDAPPRFATGHVAVIGKSSPGMRPVMATSLALPLGDQLLGYAIAGWVSHPEVDSFTICLENRHQLDLDGEQHRFFTALVRTGPRTNILKPIVIDDIAAYDVDGEVIDE